MEAITRRDVLEAAAASAALFALPRFLSAADDRAAVYAEIQKRHGEAVKRLQDWVRRPSIAAENRGMNEGCEHVMRLLSEAGFQSVTRVPTSGQPGVFARLDSGAPKTVGLYFMYDVKQADPAEWSSPPWDAALVEKPGFGKVIVGRGAVNQKGPEAAFLAALHAIRGAGRKMPVNLVLVAEGEEEIGSPHFAEIVRRPEVSQALGRCQGVFMPSAVQDPDGSVLVSLGAKGVVEGELVASGEKWGRGPKKDVHSSNRARLDEATAKRLLSADRWAHDLSWRASLERFLFTPTVNIEGLVAGHTGAGGKTVLPHRAVAKLDLRLVPDMTYGGAVGALKAHLARRGFGDVEVNPSGGYDPTQTPADAALIKAQVSVYKRAGLDPLLWPRGAGSYPGWVFTSEPLKLAAGHFGLGHGSGAHAPDEYYVIESSNPKVSGFDGAVRSFVDYLYELA